MLIQPLEGGGDPLPWLLRILVAAGGVLECSDYRHDPLRLFYDDGQERGEDTFNRAIRLGLTRTMHDGDTDISTVHITDAGRAFVSTSPPQATNQSDRDDASRRDREVALHVLRDKLARARNDAASYRAHEATYTGNLETCGPESREWNKATAIDCATRATVAETEAKAFQTAIEALSGPAGASPAQMHDELAPRLIREMWEATGTISALNVLAESLLLGVGMFNFPADPRRQALMIQEIADGAADRAKAVRKAP